MSIEDMMAAARGETSAGAPAATPTAEPADNAASITEQLEAARTPREEAAAPKAAVVKNSQEMSIEDMMAAARGESSGGAAAAEEPPAETEAEEPVAETAAVDPGDLPTDVEGIVAYCHRVDGS